MRESCISHRPREPFIMIRQDYQKLFGGDSCAAALLALIEYWSNGEIALNPKTDDRVCLGEVTATDWQEGLLNFYCGKRILERINKMIERGFLEVERPDSSRRQARVYFARIDLIQQALNQIIFCSTNGQMSSDYRTNVHEGNGHLSSSLYIESNKKKEEEPPIVPQGDSTQAPVNKPVVQVPLIPSNKPDETNPLVKTEVIHKSVPAAAMSRNPDKLNIEDFEPLREAYNAHKPALWAECKIINENRFKSFKRLFKSAGEQTLQTLVDALKFVSKDSWWSSKPMTIDNLLREGRVQEFAERYNAEYKIEAVEDATGVPVSLLKLRHDLKGFFDDDE